MFSLDEFESRLQSLLEVHLLKYLPGYRVQDGVAQQLATAMHSNLKQEEGSTLAPNLYVIIAHPDTLAHWHADPRLLKELASALYVAGKEAGFKFATKPMLSTTPDGNIPLNDLRIIVSFSNDTVDETVGERPGNKRGVAAGTIPANAFLIIRGNQIFPLDRSVINIGRRLDNHVVIDDPRVSRAHAQLRIIKDHFVLFDLNSSGGTYVNGRRTTQSVLNPGDVIGLAGISLIFGQDLPGGNMSAEGETTPGASTPGDKSEIRSGKDNENKP